METWVSRIVPRTLFTRNPPVNDLFTSVLGVFPTVTLKLTPTSTPPPPPPPSFPSRLSTPLRPDPLSHRDTASLSLYLSPTGVHYLRQTPL